jgi:hypothetical protein
MCESDRLIGFLMLLNSTDLLIDRSILMTI